MNFKGISNFFTSKVGRQALILQKHSPKIMFVVGVVGVGATVVLACRATLKVDEVLQEHEKTAHMIKSAKQGEIFRAGEKFEYSENDARRDLAILYTKTAGQFLKLYGPSIVIGVASIALLTGAHVVLSRRNLGLTAAYAALDKGFREYRQRVMDELGPDEEKKFRYGLVDEQVTDENGVPGSVVKVHPNGRHGSIYARCWDEFSTSYTPEDQGGAIYNPIFLRTQQQYANDLLRARGHVMLNDVYDMLGLPRSREGALVGWVLDGGASDNYIDFGVFENDEFTAMQFVQGQAPGIWLDFNVDGIVYDKI